MLCIVALNVLTFCISVSFVTYLMLCALSVSVKDIVNIEIDVQIAGL